jgi:hypothetical protein
LQRKEGKKERNEIISMSHKSLNLSGSIVVGLLAEETNLQFMANECVTFLPGRFDSLWDAKILVISLNTSIRCVTFHYGVIELALVSLFRYLDLSI